MELNDYCPNGRYSLSHAPAHSTLALEPSDRKTDAEYDPFKYRNVTHPTSTAGAFFHLLKSSLGSGLLAMPAAFRNSGVVPGCIGTVVVAVIATHCVHILVTTSREVCRECRLPSLSYTDTCVKVFQTGPPRCRRHTDFVRNFIDYAMAGVCIGGTGVYVVLIATSLKDLCDSLNPKLSIEAYCGILLVPLIIITQIRHLKFLVPFSVLANLCLVIIFGITCYYTFKDTLDFEEVELVNDVVRWPLFLSTAIFSMEGINMVMPVENEMAHPAHFLGCPGVLNITMGFVATLYGVVGLFGYVKYGKDIQGSITLNLPENEIPAVTAKVLVAVAVFFTYCLQMYAPMHIIWSRISSRMAEKHHNVAQIGLRTVCVGITVLLAVAVPDLELLIGLVGAIFFSTLGLLVPLVVETVHRWDRGLGKYRYVLWKNGILLLFYIVVLLSGCYASLSAIIVKYSSKKVN